MERLSRLLAELIGKIAGLTDTGRRATFGQLAKQANVDIKTGNLKAAALGLQEIQNGLALTAGEARARTDVPSSVGGAVTYAKSRLAWLAMRKKVDAEFEDFLDSVAAQYEDEGNDQVVRELVRARLTPVMDTFDDTLADTLDAAANETDPARRQELVAEARGIVDRYRSYVGDEKLLAAMDANPFAPTAIRKTMVETLQALSSALR